MTTTPNMSMVLPTDHGDAEVWGTLVNAALTLNDAHDHTTGKGVKVPVAGLNINADLSFSPSGTPRAITDLKAIDFAPVAASGVTSLAGAFFVSDGTGGLVLNELYFRTVGGTNIRVTSGTTLNVASVTGGIGGDYAAVGALVDYDDPSDTYRFRQETAAAVRQFAKLSAADVRLFEYKAAGATPVPSASVTLKSPVALGASYSVTFPGAVPGSTSLVQMDNTGVLTASNTVANALTLSTSLSVGTTLGVTGAATLTGGIANNVTLTLGATAAANQSVTVSGTGQFKHGSRQVDLHISAFQPDGATTYVTFNQIGYISGFSAVCTVQARVPLEVGKRILTYRQYYDVQGTGSSITPKLRRMNLGTGVITDVVAGVADNTGTGIESQNLTVAAGGHVILANEAYFIEVSVSTANHRVHGASISYDEP